MNKIKVLLIEDDRSISNFITATMDREGYKIMHALNGREGLSLSTSFCPNVILLDLGLPDMDGLEVLQKLRSWSDVPVIIISARTKEQEKVSALDLGADDYITKPFDMEEVLARIESNLRRVQFQNSQTECLQYNNLTLDLEKNTAFLNGIELSLTAKEFGILELLMKYPDKVFSKSNLFQSVWDTEYIAEDNTLNVHISNLRNKLKAICSDTEFIDTVWGIGYRLHKAKD